MKIALKEANETFYWLKLSEPSNHLPFDEKLRNLCEEAIKILTKIVVTSKNSVK